MVKGILQRFNLGVKLKEKQDDSFWLENSVNI